ncbi:ATP-grasp domain-containing protein [Streptomyces sp. S3(2020)]|uniref:ATP-grasp domain-containing protein n=1 Tax=Streptomyces sp. S3(2020) TaxID=2732044 RepID=UPI001487FEC4|nr:ATP-grasp domain-containing protein [Streptomyces sp. S3(2020)]NNN35496.1 ATP-grasp domain-containing protein [Streptomyces sp. S3(2020)]
MEAHAYRGYCLENVRAHYDVVLISGAEPTWEKEFLLDYVVADPTDQAALAAAGRALAERYEVVGVMTWTEWYLVPVARLARQLGLPTTAPEALQGCRNKHTSRSLFARHGVPSAISVSVRTEREAADAAALIGYPVVLKPSAHAASMGVIRVDSAADLPAAYAFAARTADHGVESTQVLVEEYLDGPEVSVECVTYQGQTTVVAVTRKTVGMPPFFEELAHAVDASDPLLAAVAPVAVAALDAVGITDGVSHVEIRIVDGRPRLIEVNARLAGDMIGHLVHLATGVDLARAGADIACGRTPDLTPTRRQAAAIRFIYPAYSGTLTARSVVRPTGGVERVRFQRQPGDQLLLPQDGGNLFTARIGFVIATGPTATAAQRRAQEAYRNLDVQVTPATQTAPATGEHAA